ncbi:MAG: amidohydrolase family protein [Nocardioides sp.]|uniref:amidohydrolase family protein n=1 Tax=Nocardioides sp. TaxID=35761 RepID=UPI0039E2555F
MTRRAIEGGQPLLIRDATLVAAPGAEPRPRTSLFVVHGAIAAIGEAAEAAARAGEVPDGRMVDAAGGTLVAGFWNCHVHLTQPGWRGAVTAPVERLQDALDDLANRRGFTGLVDLGSNPFDTREVRRRIGTGELRGPEIAMAGLGLYPPRGLPFYSRDEMGRLGRAITPQPRTRAAARLAVAANRRLGAEVTKLFTGSYVAPDTVKPMSRMVAFAAAQRSRAFGMPVFAHPSDRAGTLVALDAGVDVLAHVPDETQGTHGLLREAATRGIWMTPTLDMFAQTVTRDRAYLDPIHSSLRLFRDHGGRLLFGTDVGYLPDTDMTGELEALAECGLGVVDVLTMLTTAPARAFGSRFGPATGEVAEGGVADLVLLDRLETVTDLASVRMTIRAGRVTWRST